MSFLQNTHYMRTKDSIRGHGDDVEARIRERRLNRIRERQHTADLQRRAQHSEPTSDGEERSFPNSYEESFVSDRPEHNEDWSDRSNESESPTDTTQNARRTSIYDRIVFYAMWVQHYGMSAEEARRNEHLLRVILDTDTLPITYDRDVAPMNETILKDYDKQKYFFCPICNEEMFEKATACRNNRCRIYGLKAKRAKWTQRVEVHTMKIVPQLSDILLQSIEEMISFHGDLHANRATPNEDRSDVRLFDGYYGNIESAEQFREKRIRVLLTLSLDGYRARRLSKREIWPLYLRVEGLPPKEANNFYNSIIAGAIYSRLKPGEALMETLFSRLRFDLEALKDAPLEVVIDGISWTVEVQLYRGIADFPAQQALYAVPRWTSDYGCSKCHIKGMRIGNHRIWAHENDDDTILRDPESYLSDAQEQRNGLTKATFMMKLMPPCDFLGDALHICSEGITRNRLRDLFSPSSIYPGLKVGREKLENIRQCLLGVTNYTYSNSLISSLEDTTTCKAAEIDELAFVAFPLAVAVDSITCPVSAAGLLGYWLTIRVISKTLDLTTTVIEMIQYVAHLTRDVWLVTAAKVFTMKCHWFFDHAMDIELPHQGSLYQWTSAPFESHHRRLQLKMNQTTTNSASLILEKYLLTKKIRNLFYDCSENNENPLFGSFKEKIENKHTKRFPLEVRVNEHCYIPKNSRIDLRDLQEPERTRISRSSDEPYSRLVVHGKVYCSSKYWKRKATSRQDLVYLKGSEWNEDLETFGSVILFMYNRANNTVRVLLEEFHICDPFEHLHNLVNHCDHQGKLLAVSLMRSVRENNNFFHEMTGRCVRSRSAFLIRGACTLIVYGNHTYVSRL